MQKYQIANSKVIGILTWWPSVVQLSQNLFMTPPLRLHIFSHLWILDFGLWILDFGFGMLDLGFGMLDFVFWPGGLVLYNCHRIYSWLPPLRLHIFKVIFSSLLFRNTVTIAILLLNFKRAWICKKFHPRIWLRHLVINS